MELKYSQTERQGVLERGKFNPHVVEVTLTHVHFDDADRANFLPEKFLAGTYIEDYMDFEPDGTIVLEGELTEKDALEELKSVTGCLGHRCVLWKYLTLF